MIALGADDWKLLEHAYGPAEDIPRLLEQLAEDPRPKSHYEEEPWFTLWSSLCHQGDVYTASYAAVPHIVGICLSSDGPVDLGFFQLPACVKIAHATGFGPAMPSQLVDDYKNALSQLHDCAFRHASHDWDEGMTLSVAAALAVANGHIRAAETIINLDDDIMARIISGDL